ncbi:MAG TPA: cyclase family protein [Acidimicrobiia bacterium]|nr:cyclase family protein [Acidimicrobiia bacterium]
MSEASGWQRGRGWGWVWGDADEVGALNHMTSATMLEALSAPKEGRVYDLGAPLDRGSFLWPGHVGTEVIPFRTADGLKKGGDFGEPPDGLSFFTSMIILSDHAGTQLDGLCHATKGADNHWYNGFTAADWATDFGPRRASAVRIPPIIAPGVLIDVPAHLGIDELPASHPVTADDLQDVLESQGTTIEPGSVVLIRTGTMRHWGEAGHDHAALTGPDSSGITHGAARWLVEECGAMIIGGDTSTLEVVPPVDGEPSPSPVHEYLLVEQGVHMGELHFLEELSVDRRFAFTYIALVPPVVGATAGFALRPIAIV